MWYKAKCSSKPQEIDTESSQEFVYIRKDFMSKKTIEPITGGTVEIWEYLEKKVKKTDDWELYENMLNNKQNIISAEQTITDLDIAIIELTKKLEELEKR